MGYNYNRLVNNSQKIVETKMLNPNTLATSGLPSFNLFTSALNLLPRLSQSPAETISERALPSHRANRQPSVISIPMPIPISTRNTMDALSAMRRGAIDQNMTGDVAWFARMALYEAIVSIVLVFFVAMGLWFVGLYSLPTATCVAIGGFLYFGLKHGIFRIRWLRRWTQVSLLACTFVLCHQILITTINTISHKTAQLLFFNHLTLVPALLVTLMLVVYHYAACLLLNPYQTCERSYHNCFTFNLFTKNVRQLLINLYNIKYFLLKVYGILFLVLYVVVAGIKFYDILMNGQGYTTLLHPIVFVGQFVAFLWMVLLYHTIVYLIDQPILWNFTPLFYSDMDNYSRVPRVLQLLKVIPSSSTKQQTINTPLQYLTKIFASPSSFLSDPNNTLTRSQQQNIHIHSLSWLIWSLNSRNENLKSRISIYNYSPYADGYRPSVSTSYEEIFLHFANKEIEKCINLLYGILNKITDIGIWMGREGNALHAAMDRLRVQGKEMLLWGDFIQCGNQLGILDYVLEILALADVDFNGCGAGISQIREKLEKLKELVTKVEEVEWVEDIVWERMHGIGNRIGKLLAKVSK